MVLETDPDIPFLIAIITYINYALLILIGHTRDFFASLSGVSRYPQTKPKPGYSVLFKSWESFYTRRLYHRIQDCWGRSVSSAPGARIEVVERSSHDYNCTLFETGKRIKCLNLGSYNYLGFADDWQQACRADVMHAVERWPASMCAARLAVGSVALHEELEQTISRFLGKEAAMIFPMGYGTNTTIIPILTGPGSLIISDSLNHLSIVNGARAAQAQIRIFRHNDIANLEEILREAVVKGQPKYYRPWKKIWVMVEGIYSMEGDICLLPEIVRVCKKYKAYLYVDEAHSIGALGKTGRGVCEHTGVSTADIDILMGTFTKSFSGMGGYIAASKRTIDYIRARCAASLYHNSMSPIVCKQILTALRIISGEDGTDLGQRKLKALKDNSNYFRSELHRIGVHVYGSADSPIIPLLIYMPSKIAALSRECLKRGVAIVVVGFPATSVVYSRARFCISAGHTRADLQYAVQVLDEVTTMLMLKYQRRIMG